MTEDLATPDRIAARVAEFSAMSDEQLVAEVSRSLPGYAAHAAASQLLFARRERSERKRFWLNFIAAALAALLAGASLYFQVFSPSSTATSAVPTTTKAVPAGAGTASRTP
ncbi:hypothetical protein [Caldimonas caldifontis]|uniref:hypothetical protein n=1 Tax=Caldimonas caldifontis TaxID=1452508 RepID=UPI0011B0DA9C|nr:hypothetical protein [Caldimonas caldifontis]